MQCNECKRELSADEPIFRVLDGSYTTQWHYCSHCRNCVQPNKYPNSRIIAARHVSALRIWRPYWANGQGRSHCVAQCAFGNTAD